MYGCFPPKLAETLGKPKAQGQLLFDKFWEANAPIKLLVESLEDEYDRTGGKIKSLDGRMLYVRDKRKLLNTLLQNAATVVFKNWSMRCNNFLSYTGTKDVNQIIAYHDELQFESRLTKLETTAVGTTFCDLALQAGEYFNVAVPTPADLLVGKNWEDTH